MKPINATRNLNEYTRKQGVWIGGTVFSLHILDDEVIITDNEDYSKIYSIESFDYRKFCCSIEEEV